MTSTQQRAELQRRIWQIANDVRGAVDGWDFMALPTPAEKATVKLLTDHLKTSHAFWQQQEA